MNTETRTIAFVLLRQQTIPFIRQLVESTSHAQFESRGVSGTWDQVRQQIEESIQWGYSVDPRWRIHGKPLSENARQFEQFELEMYPWGCDYTGLMFAVCSNSLHFNRVLKALSGMEEYVLAQYSVSEFMEEKSAGFVIIRDARRRAWGIWGEGNLQFDTALLLRWEETDTSPIGRVICSRRENVHGETVYRKWIEVKSETEFIHLAANDQTCLVVGKDAEESFLHKSLEDFAIVARDPLFFGIKALSSVSWIYIPRTEREKNEIFFDKDWRFTSGRLNSSIIQSSEFFKLHCRV